MRSVPGTSTPRPPTPALRRRGRGVLAALAPVLLAAALAACGGPQAPAPGTPAPATLRSLEQGQVVGFEGRYGAHVWRGIPFAAPPVGPLRWRAPRPPEPWQGVRQALAFGSPCPQIASPMGGWDGAEPGEPTGAEDCLSLNVYAPPFAADAVPRGPDRRPVMVWIHGGGNSIGDAWLYDGGHLATAHGVVVVTVHYRLGPLGWFRHPALRGPGTSALDRSGNYGTLDLLAALHWVRRNIAAFGGDPDRVLVFGESAGGHNVYTLLLSPLARGLFQRAVVESGGLRGATPAEAENPVDAAEPGDAASSHEVLLKLLEADGAAGRAAAEERLAAMSAPQVEAFLRGQEPAALLRAYDTFGGTGMLDMPRVFRDGWVLPREPFPEVLAEGRYNQVPTILGTNRDENKLFMAFDPHWVRTLFRVPLWPRDPEAYERIARYRSRAWKASAVDEPAMAMRAAQGPSVWAYRFDWDDLPRILWLDLPTLLGAAHAMEIPFVFGHFDLGRFGHRLWNEDNAASREPLSAAMMSYWAQLAWAGDPARGRGGDLPPWRAWGQNGETFLVLDAPADGGVRMVSERVTGDALVEQVLADPGFADDAERCDLLRELAERGPGLDAARIEALPACGSIESARSSPGSPS